MTITSHVDYSDLLYTLSCRRAAARRKAEQQVAIERATQDRIYRDIRAAFAQTARRAAR